MVALKPNTQGGRLLRVLVKAWPAWSGGPLEFGIDFYTARNRMGDTLARRGFRTVNRKRKNHSWHEWRFESQEVFLAAEKLVLSWDMQRNTAAMTSIAVERNLQLLEGDIQPCGRRA